MENKTCVFCRTENERTIELFPDIRAAQRQPFCGLCIDTGACRAYFAAGPDRTFALEELAANLMEELRSMGKQPECFGELD